MSDTKATTLNLITQVSKDDNNQSLIYNASENQSSTSSRTTSVPPRRGLLASLCCCFFPKDSRETEATRKDLPLVPVGGEPFLLPPPTPDIIGKKTLVLDLDETLVHSSFKPIPNPDFIIPVEIEDQVHKVYVAKRPGVDQFLSKLGPTFEIVVFTASLAKYADPVLDLLDASKVVKSRLFREACSNYKGNYVKDLNKLGRELKNTVIIDNSPSSFLFHTEYAIGCESWFDDEQDTELLELIPFLEALAKSENVKTFLESRRKDGKLMYK